MHKTMLSAWAVVVPVGCAACTHTPPPSVQGRTYILFLHTLATRCSYHLSGAVTEPGKQATCFEARAAISSSAFLHAGDARRSSLGRSSMRHFPRPPATSIPLFSRYLVWTSLLRVRCFFLFFLSKASGSNWALDAVKTREYWLRKKTGSGLR